MRNTIWTPALSILGVALLITSCAGDASALDSEESPTLTEESDADDFEGDLSVPLSEEHLAEGVDMPDCLAEENDMYVEPGAVLDEDDLVWMCPAEPAEDREFRPSQQIIAVGNEVEFRYLPGEDGAGVEVHHLHCEDPEALAEKAEHNGDSQPIGWPQEWDAEDAMPDPYCHPDYLEVGEWEHLEAFVSRWEGTETSTLADQGQPQDEINSFLWEQSQARAGWAPTD